MFKIGDFAHICRISVKTLRHYDEIDLLKPVQVDEWTGYRYYSLEQLPQLNRILALKDFGFSLEQIGHLLKESVPLAQLQGMLRLKQAELQRHVTDEQARLQRIEGRLKQIEQEGTMSNLEVVIREVEPQTVVMSRCKLANYDEMIDWIEQAQQRISDTLTQSGVQRGQSMGIWHGFGEDDLEIEAGYALDAKATLPTDGPQMQVYTLPAQRMATLIYHGSYASSGVAWQTLSEWMEANNQPLQMPTREVHHKGGHDLNDESYVTEFQFPLA